MNVDTEAIRRLRDHLLASPQAGDGDGAGRNPAPEALLRRVEPFAETMFLVMGADDDRAEVEHDALRAALAALTGGALTAADLENLLMTFQANLAREGREARLARIGAWISRDSDDRETAFALAAAVAIADDRVDPAEDRVLDWVREYFGLSARQVLSVLESRRP